MSVKVGGLRYSVDLISPNIPNPVSIEGFTEFEQLQIGIKSDLSQKRLEWVAWHEFVHAILDSLAGEQDEENVRLVSSAFYAFLTDNDLLRDGWFEGVIDSKNGDMPRSSGKVIVDKDDTAVEHRHESIRRRDNAKEVPASGGEQLGGYSE